MSVKKEKPMIFVTVCIHPSTGEMVLVQLLNWVRWHFSMGREMAQDVINEEKPEDHPAYWEAVSQCRNAMLASTMVQWCPSSVTHPENRGNDGLEGRVFIGEVVTCI